MFRFDPTILQENVPFLGYFDRTCVAIDYNNKFCIVLIVIKKEIEYMDKRFMKDR